jgi:hypothetical protein
MTQLSESQDRYQEKQESSLPKIGSLLETMNHEIIRPDDTRSEKGCSIRCNVSDPDEGDSHWFIHHEHSGLVVILKPEPTQDFDTVKVTGHAKSGRCIFAKVVH